MAERELQGIPDAQHQVGAWSGDPTGRHEWRWWDGFRWTDHVADRGVSTSDPYEPLPPPAPADAGGQLQPPAANTAVWTSGAQHAARTASDMTFGEAVRVGLGNYAELGGRATRPEFWWFFAFMWLAVFGASFVDVALGTDGGLFGLTLLALFLPNLAVTVRRLHDSGNSGWCVLFGLIPFVGVILLLVLLASKGEPRINAYGQVPA